MKESLIYEGCSSFMSDNNIQFHNHGEFTIRFDFLFRLVSTNS